MRHRASSGSTTEVFIHPVALRSAARQHTKEHWARTMARPVELSDSNLAAWGLNPLVRERLLRQDPDRKARVWGYSERVGNDPDTGDIVLLLRSIGTPQAHRALCGDQGTPRGVQLESMARQRASAQRPCSATIAQRPARMSAKSGFSSETKRAERKRAVEV